MSDTETSRTDDGMSEQSSATSFTSVPTEVLDDFILDDDAPAHDIFHNRPIGWPYPQNVLPRQQNLPVLDLYQGVQADGDHGAVIEGLPLWNHGHNVTTLGGWSTLDYSPMWHDEPTLMGPPMGQGMAYFPPTFVEPPPHHWPLTHGAATNPPVRLRRPMRPYERVDLSLPRRLNQSQEMENRVHSIRALNREPDDETRLVLRVMEMFDENMEINTEQLDELMDDIPDDRIEAFVDALRDTLLAIRY